MFLDQTNYYFVSPSLSAFVSLGISSFDEGMLVGTNFHVTLISSSSLSSRTLYP